MRLLFIIIIIHHNIQDMLDESPSLKYHSLLLTKTMVTTFWLAGDNNRPIPHQSSETAWENLGEVEGE